MLTTSNRSKSISVTNKVISTLAKTSKIWPPTELLARLQVQMIILSPATCRISVNWTSGLDVTESTQPLVKLSTTSLQSGNQLLLAITILKLQQQHTLAEDDNFPFLSKLPKRSFSLFWLLTLENTKEQLCSLSIPVFSLRLTQKRQINDRPHRSRTCDMTLIIFEANAISLVNMIFKAKFISLKSIYSVLKYKSWYWNNSEFMRHPQPTQAFD